MAQIKAYDAGNLKLQPSEIGVESTAAAGRRVGTFFNQLGAGEQELGRDQARLGGETGQLGREAGQFSRELGSETARLGTAKARALNSWGEGVGSGIKAGGEAAINYQTHKEVSSGSKAFADFGLAKTKELNDTLANADPNDPSTIKNFMDGLEPDLQKLKDSFTTDHGQQWAEAHIEHLRQGFQAQAQAGTATLAKKAFTDNYRGTLNSLSATAYENPASLPEQLAALESSVTATVASSPNLKGVDAVTLHGEAMQKGAESLVKSAALGHINSTGQVPDWLNDPQYSKYVNASEVQLFARTAQATTKRMEADNKSAERNQKLLDQANGLKRADELHAQWKNDDGSLNLPKDYRKQIWDDPDIRKYPAAGRELEREYNSIEKGEKSEKITAVSERTTRDLDAQIRSGQIINGDKISDAFDEGKLTRTDHDWLQKKVNEARTETGAKINKTKDEFLKAVKSQVDNSLQNPLDTTAGERMFRFSNYIDGKIQDKRASGGNWTDLFNPNSPDYLGHDVKQFSSPSTQESTTTRAAATPAKPPAGIEPRKTGESFGAWLSRSGRGLTPAPAQAAQ
jgi:hypothetical protein